MIKYLPAEFIPGTKEYYLYRISRKSQAIYLGLILIILILLTGLPLIHFDIAVSAPGIIKTDLENQTVYSNSQGLIIFSQVSNNRKVSQGDTLLIFDSKVQVARLASLLTKQIDNQNAIIDLEYLINLDSLRLAQDIYHFNSPKYSSEYNSFKRQYLNQKARLTKKNMEHNRNTQLYKQKVISDSDYEVSEFEVDQELTNLRVLILHQIKIWQDDLTNRYKEKPIIESDIKYVNDEITNRHILAPVDGTIIFSSDIQSGGFLLMNQRIAEISPEGELVVLASILPRDIGYIKIGQRVRVQVDAYNYNQWGMLEASVERISDDIILDSYSNRPYYRIHCRLLSDTLIHKNGSIGLLKKGMTVNCSIIQTRKSLFELLVNKADLWLNPYSKVETEKSS
jgi:membrane fusion protein, peptide pheromone/bacteriocin exporter